MTDYGELLDRVRAGLDGVTDGPWGMETKRTSCGVCHQVGPWPHKWRAGGEMSACIYDDYPSPPEGTDNMLANARFIAAARSDVPALAHALEAVIAERDEARKALERDRSQVAETIEAVRTEVAGREWLLEGRGPYEWDDDRYRDEFAQALAAIRGPIDSLREIARDWTNCPTDPKEIKAARTSEAAALRARLAELEDVTGYVLQDDLLNSLTPRVIDIAYSAFMVGRAGENRDDGGPCDWFTDTLPMVVKKMQEISAALRAKAKEAGE